MPFKKKIKDYIHFLYCSNSFKDSIENFSIINQKNSHELGVLVFLNTAPLLQRKHICDYKHIHSTAEC